MNRETAAHSASYRVTLVIWQVQQVCDLRLWNKDEPRDGSVAIE